MRKWGCTLTRATQGTQGTEGSSHAGASIIFSAQVMPFLLPPLFHPHAHDRGTEGKYFLHEYRYQQCLMLSFLRIHHAEAEAYPSISAQSQQLSS